MIIQVDDAAEEGGDCRQIGLSIPTKKRVDLGQRWLLQTLWLAAQWHRSVARRHRNCRSLTSTARRTVSVRRPRRRTPRIPPPLSSSSSLAAPADYLCPIENKKFVSCWFEEDLEKFGASCFKGKRPRVPIWPWWRRWWRDCWAIRRGRLAPLVPSPPFLILPTVLLNRSSY